MGFFNKLPTQRRMYNLIKMCLSASLNKNSLLEIRLIKKASLPRITSSNCISQDCGARLEVSGSLVGRGVARGLGRNVRGALVLGFGPIFPPFL